MKTISVETVMEDLEAALEEAVTAPILVTGHPGGQVVLVGVEHYRKLVLATGAPFAMTADLLTVGDVDELATAQCDPRAKRFDAEDAPDGDD